MPKGAYERTEEHKRNLSKIHKGQIPWNKGKKLSAEHIKKLSEAHLGNHYPKISEAGKGRKVTLVTRRKMSVAHKSDKNSNWQGGKTSISKTVRKSIETKLWRDSVFARDGWTCQKCSEVGGNLHPHHILNFAQYPELRFAIDNGITFCEDCHEGFHKIYGYRDNTREQLIEFLVG